MLDVAAYRALSEANRRCYATALAWGAHLAIPHAVGWLDEEALGFEGLSPRARSAETTYAALHAAQHALFAAEGFPHEGARDAVLWRQDALGKPYVVWEGAAAQWATACGRDCRFLHVSNTHDGGAHLVFAAYAVALVGVGIDLVHLPRLRRPSKDRDYLRRFARQFMSAEEEAAFEASAAGDDEEAYRVRVAAHFSLMEAASKACGTGLRLGIGARRSTTLPKQALGVEHLTPAVSLLFGPEAQARLTTLGVTRWEAHWGADDDYLVSVVLLWR